MPQGHRCARYDHHSQRRITLGLFSVIAPTLSGFQLQQFRFGITKRVSTEIHFRSASELRLIEIYYRLRRAASPYLLGEIRSAIRERREMHAYECI